MEIPPPKHVISVTKPDLSEITVLPMIEQPVMMDLI